MSMVRTGIIKRSSCKSNAVSRVSVGQHKLVRSRGNREVSGEGQPRGESNAWRLTPLGERVTEQLSLNGSAHKDGA